MRSSAIFWTKPQSNRPNIIADFTQNRRGLQVKIFAHISCLAQVNVARQLSLNCVTWVGINVKIDEVELARHEDMRIDILENFGDTIDLERLKLSTIEDLQFNPTGLLKHKKVHELFRMISEDAASF